MNKDKIVKQAIQRIDWQTVWVYSQWESGKYTRYLVIKIDTGKKIGPHQEIKNIPVDLKWVEV